MPVPISVTHQKGMGLAAAQPAELPTSGSLFSGLGKTAVDTGVKQQSVDVARQQEGAAGPALLPQQTGSSGTDIAVATNGLTFSYPDIGEFPFLQMPNVSDVRMSLPVSSALRTVLCQDKGSRQSGHVVDHLYPHTYMDLLPLLHLPGWITGP